MSLTKKRPLRPLVHFSLAFGFGALACSSGTGSDSDSDNPSVTTGGAAATAGGSSASTGGATGVGGAVSGDGGLQGSGGGSTVVTTTVCATAAEEEAATLTCPEASTITAIDFASFGTATGQCEGFAQGTCHAPESQAILEAACLGKSTCSVEATNAEFGGDPCSFVVKNLNVQATCTSDGTVGGVGGTPGTGGANSTGGATSTGGSGSGVWNEGTELKAFPTAGGYGRNSKGGRGGRVIKVTNLNDSGAGSLRAAVEATGPRTVVFDVSGVINLKSKLVIRPEHSQLTIAGQTAPAKGVVVHGWTFGLIGGSDVTMRFIRTRIGTSSGETMDGMGITGAEANNVIYDHNSISWTIDEAFSSRGASNFTLQRTLISEALNEAGHDKYPAGTQHGYAASIGGDIGTFHHNLLAHCSGRNWSLAGGLGKSPVEFAGRLDIRNNVVYNWRNRTTDGGAHEVNFVNNYYKPGPVSEIFVALNAQLENFPGTQSYFFSGNVMPGKFDESSQDKGRKISYINRTESSVTWDVFVDEEFFPSYVTTQSAGDAYEDVLADVGANRPVQDDHDKRIIQETRDGTAKYKGSKTGLAGLPDNEADVGGLENYPQESRPSGWDTDDDGMPNAWETEHGLDPNDAEDRNGTNLSKVGYTNLEMYLNELAGDLD